MTSLLSKCMLMGLAWVFYCTPCLANFQKDTVITPQKKPLPETVIPKGSKENNPADETTSATRDTISKMIKVVDAFKETVDEQEKTTDPKKSKKIADTSRQIALNDILVVKLNNLQALISLATQQKKEIILFLDGRPVVDANLYPPVDPADNLLKFTIKKADGSKTFWTYLLGGAHWKPRRVKVSVGLEDKYALHSSAFVHLDVIPGSLFIFWTVLFAILFIGFIYLAYKSDVLREPVPIPGGNNRKPFSLSRSQAAWWCFVVIAAYLFIGVITGDFSTSITGTVLGLLGISAGTAVGSAFVDASKTTPTDNQLQSVSAQNMQTQVMQIVTEVEAFNKSIADNTAEVTAADKLYQTNKDDASLTSLQSKRTELAALQAQLADKLTEKLTKESQLKKLNNTSENFLLDILSDINGVTFHRFQIVAWTIVLGIIFIVQVYQTLAMPTFDSSLLALMGISAGTYLGLKIPEQSVPQKQ